jgi:hypothetical protein
MAFRPDVAHFAASREVHTALSDRLLNEGEVHSDGSRSVAKWLPNGQLLELNDYWSFAHEDHPKKESFTSLLQSGGAVLLCNIHTQASTTPNLNRPVFSYRPDSIKEKVIGGQALRDMANYTPEEEFVTAIMPLSFSTTIPVMRPHDHDLIKPFLQ